MPTFPRCLCSRNAPFLFVYLIFFSLPLHTLLISIRLLGFRRPYNASCAKFKGACACRYVLSSYFLFPRRSSHCRVHNYFSLLLSYSINPYFHENLAPLRGSVFSWLHPPSTFLRKKIKDSDLVHFAFGILLVSYYHLFRKKKLTLRV